MGSANKDQWPYDVKGFEVSVLCDRSALLTWTKDSDEEGELMFDMEM